jgi:EAL domain-containing protein (putative c-di-GMP-specific phosphodiesterase class I)
MLMNDTSETRNRMHAIKALGVGFSLDDFGTGYSSLAHLQRLPLDQLKIDQSFVQTLLTQPSDAAVARSVIALGHSLGMTVIAEGVETAEQRNLLAELGCDAFQGYFFGRPSLAADLNSSDKIGL